MRSSTSWGGAAAAALLLFLARGTPAASLDVNPVRIDLPPAARSAELRLTNTSNEALSIQVDVREWSQDFDGAEQLFDTHALLAVPPIVTIPPGERQIVRIGHLGAPDEDVEKSFRVLVTELSGARVASDKPALSMRLRLSIPVFVAPASGAAAADVDVEDVAPSDGGMRLTLHNTGNAHAKIERIDVRDDAEWSTLPPEIVSSVRYLLPDARARLALPQEVAHVTAIRIKSEDGGEWEHAVSALP
jgi:fimbrial chaperone protein